MKWIIRIVGTLVVLIAVLAVVGFLLPRNVEVTRSTVIDATPEAIWPHVSALNATQAWSPWLERDPDVVVTYEGPEQGVGNKMSWVSEVDNVGTGSQEITAAVEHQSVDTALDFGEMGQAKAQILLSPQGDSTEVSWNFETDMGSNPVARWMGLMMDGMLGPDYETGLGNLKNLVEGG